MTSCYLTFHLHALRSSEVQRLMCTLDFFFPHSTNVTKETGGNCICILNTFFGIYDTVHNFKMFKERRWRSRNFYLRSLRAAFSLSLPHLPRQVLHTFRGGRSPPLTRLGGLLASCSGFSFSLWNAGGEDTAGRFLKVSFFPAPDFCGSILLAPFPFILGIHFFWGGGTKFSIYY